MSATTGGWELVFWLALLLPVYSYALFPVIVGAMGGMARRRVAAPALAANATNDWPPVAFVASAYNEEQHIADLVHNLLALNYPGKVTLYLGSDGSSDRTAEILQAHSSPNVRVFAYHQNRGKASVLNDLLAAVTEPIVAFTDANTQLAPDALRQLVRHFSDARVGVVCGELELRSVDTGDNVDGMYWRMEMMLKANESALGALLGANGGIYAMRRECYVPLKPDTIVDDFCIAMTAAAKGWLLVYESGARAVEEMPAQIRDEFRRRVRIGIGNYQAFFRHPEYLFKTSAMTRVAYVSHKVLRWFTPHLMLIALLSSVGLWERPLYHAFVYLQLGGYIFCWLIYELSRRVTVPRLLRLPVFLVVMNAAFGVAFYRYVTGQYSGSWKRTARA